MTPTYGRYEFKIVVSGNVIPVLAMKGKHMKKTTSFLGNLSNLEKVLFVILGLLVGCLVCVVSFKLSSKFLFNDDSIHTLSAEEIFEVSAIDVVETEGYTVTSAVCEVLSSERYTIQGVDYGKIVFHAFRISKPSISSEAVVVFASNHTARDGIGLVWTVNTLAKSLFPEFPDSSLLKHPITMDTPGAQDALECAQQADVPPAIDMGSFDVEAWREEAIKRFGPEKSFPDGSKDDYVRLGFSICKYVKENPGVRYDEGSDQQWIVETFCPHVK
ncbi:MAG: hypothetical protein C3F07_12295 [Anaerolineales bacterium]|nr:MAG: hypothetical protein C3F07_12295 [Anaerolineales bacterium]